MDISGGIRASLAGRYAAALFDLARDNKSIEKVEASLESLAKALDESSELRELCNSQIVERKAKASVMGALAQTMKLDPLTSNILGVLADNRRLAQFGNMINAFQTLAAHHRGEVKAEVISAWPLDDAQLDEIRKQLKDRSGHAVKINTRVDRSILGGLIVKIGSQMIDSSIKTRLNTLANAMKG